MATKTVKLLSTKGRAQLIQKFYFYDGEVDIKDGIVEIPADRPEWVQRAYIMGYRFDPATEEVLTLAEALAGGRTAQATPEKAPAVKKAAQPTARKTAKPKAKATKTVSTKSAGRSSNESSNTRRQPSGPDGVRAGEQQGG